MSRDRTEQLSEWLHENYSFLYAYLVKLTLHPAEAEDLAQDTVIRCIERFSQFRPEKASFSTWMIQIATNLWLDKKRRKKREQTYLNKQQLEWNLGDELGIEVAEALRTLKDHHRIPVILKYTYGYSYEEIATICNVSTGTIKSRLHHAMANLRKELGEDERQDRRKTDQRSSGV
ncbi:sigma-70 family RNA polymerase sigma factor [Jeotgalibacillus haloalkalitolerans]|uniref:Sigma-70 family RNA polymerase sigma factor n=1 Tax=Jeotgalibacillus haloalkalitolerans TaxID=3104292 RepID=A0ABU5KHC1_9BACL|nr:sigma-70 family RNA polymerase sigma factor [Jeotgalibacillus sp. HH7-29]MDZ5710582.1 sigma-70 family RNA polymerase sigma factor [Jeotgalibacillus sp. HH7-29]